MFSLCHYKTGHNGQSYTHILVYVGKYVHRKIPRSEIAGSKSQRNYHFEGYNAIVFHATGLFAPHKHHRRVSACLGEEMFEDRWAPVLGAALKTPCDREVLVAPREHWKSLGGVKSTQLALGLGSAL